MQITEMHAESNGPTYHGLLAEFSSAQGLLDAARRAHTAGYRSMDAFTPFPIEALSEIVCDHHKSKVPLVCLVGGVVGALSGWALSYWTSAVDYPLNIGGKPFNSWPAFIPVIFETTVLFAAFSAGLGMLALNRFPEPYHPVFNVERFRAKASRDGFFLCLEATDAKFDRETSRRFLEESGAVGVHDVQG
jgi:hypothetical protein